MRHLIKKLLFPALLIGPVGFSFAQDAGLPGAYLNFAGGPQPLGMGRAFTGLAEGTDALTYNPAGFGFLRPNIVSFLHTQTPEDARLEYVGYAQPFYGYGGFGLGYVRFDSGQVPETNQFNQQVGNFSNVEQTMMLGYGISPFHRFSLGGTFKFVQQSLAGGSSNGWGADIGGLARLNYGLSVGLMIKNAVAPSLYSGADQFPRSAVLGLAEKVLRDRLVLTLDAERTINAPQAVQFRLGAEGTIWQVVRLRAGFDYTAKDFSLGMGYLWGRTGIDYASTSGSQGEGATNRFGMTYAWGGYDVSVFASPSVFSPVGLTKTTNMAIKVDADRPIYSWALEILNQNQAVVRSIRGGGRPPSELEWDGTTESGTMVPPGIYTYTLTVTDKDGRGETTPPRTVKVEYGTPVESIELHGNR